MSISTSARCFDTNAIAAAPTSRPRTNELRAGVVGVFWGDVISSCFLSVGGGLSSRFGVFVRMVIGSSFERSGPSAGVAAGHKRPVSAGSSLARTLYVVRRTMGVRCTIVKPSRE